MKIKGKENIKGLLMVLLISLLSTGCAKKKEEDFYVPYTERSTQNEENLFKEESTPLDKLYNETFKRVMDPERVEELDGDDFFEKLTRRFVSRYYRTYRSLSSIGFYLIPASMMIGFMIMIFSKNNKSIKKTGLVVFVIGIPVSILLFIYGVGILNGKWLF